MDSLNALSFRRSSLPSAARIPATSPESLRYSSSEYHMAIRVGSTSHLAHEFGFDDCSPHVFQRKMPVEALHTLLFAFFSPDLFAHTTRGSLGFGAQRKLDALGQDIGIELFLRDGRGSGSGTMDHIAPESTISGGFAGRLTVDPQRTGRRSWAIHSGDRLQSCLRHRDGTPPRLARRQTANREECSLRLSSPFVQLTLQNEDVFWHIGPAETAPSCADQSSRAGLFDGVEYGFCSQRYSSGRLAGHCRSILDDH